MSSTRHRSDGEPPPQERYASGKAFRKGLLGNLVSRRCAKVKTLAGRELIHFLADLSHREPSARHPTANLFPAWPWPSAVATEESAFERLARELGELAGGVSAQAQRRLPGYLARLALDATLPVETAALAGWPDLFPLLRSYQAKFESSVASRIAETATKREVFELLDYALCQGHGLFIAEGAWRSGKSYAAQAWAMMHLGRCRYLQLTSAPDERSFLAEIARALGVACGLGYKIQQIRPRIEAVLREQQLLLLVDEGQYIWPPATRPKELPQRVNFIMTSLLNYGVPVVLVGSTNFSRLMNHVALKLPTFGMAQWKGRIRLHRQLSNHPTQEDLFAIGRLLIPACDGPTLMLLVGTALSADVPLTALESAAARAQYFASQAGRPVRFEDVERVYLESFGPDALAQYQRPATPARKAREASAKAAAHAATRHPAALSPLPTFPRMFTGSRPTVTG